MDYGRLITAMVTPYNDDLSINWEGVDLLVDHLLDHGTEGIVVAGTTGESPTLTKDEKLQLFERVLRRTQGRAKVIAGTGSNNTNETIVLTKKAEELGVDGILLVTPYYNRPSQEGLYQHFKAVAEATKLPIMLYNVPGRTGVNMTADTVIRLSKIENITSIKEASGDLTQIATIIEGTSEDFLLYSGDDKLFLPSLSVGAHGIVSVASHVVGNEMVSMVNAFLQGNHREAASIHRKLLPVFEGLFFTSSPAPVKAALQLQGIDAGGVRLPLLPLTEEEKAYVKQFMHEYVQR